MAKLRKPPLLLLATLALPAVLLIAVIAVFLTYDRGFTIQPSQSYLFQGAMPGMGEVNANLMAEDGPSLIVTTKALDNELRLAGKTAGSEFLFAERAWSGDRSPPETNCIIQCTLLASPFVLVGSISNAATRGFKEFELHPVARNLQLWYEAGVRIRGRGWHHTFMAEIPAFEEPTPLDRLACEWMEELMRVKAQEIVSQRRPPIREQWRYWIRPPKNPAFPEFVSWSVEYRTPDFLSLRAEHYWDWSSTVECHTFWSGNGEPQRIELANLFLPDADWQTPLGKMIMARRALKEQQEYEHVQVSVIPIDWEEDPPACVVSNRGIIFYTNPVDDKLRIFIPFTELEDILRRDGPVAALRKPAKK